jgi:hypothetical protein
MTRRILATFFELAFDLLTRDIEYHGTRKSKSAAAP